MLDPITATMATSTFGLVSGFLFRMIGEGRKATEHRQLMMLKAMDASDKSADTASVRAKTGYLRWFFGIAVVVSVVVVPIFIAFGKDVDLMYPVRHGEWEILWGLWKWGGHVAFEKIGGYPYLPEVLQAFNLYISFVVGQKPAK